MFLTILFIDIITPIILSTQTACDVIVCATHNSIIFTEYIEKNLFFSIVFFCRLWSLFEKIRAVLHKKSNLKIKNPESLLIKKLIISYCIISEINTRNGIIYWNGYLCEC